MRTSTAMNVAAAVLLAAGVMAAQQGPPAPGGGFVAYPQRTVDPAAVERGKSIYSVNCAFCHGADARGGDMGPSLLRSEIVLGDQSGEVIGPVVLKGRPPTMPPFTLTTVQIADVAAFLHSFPVSSRTGPSKINILVGDPRAGEAYFKTKCAGCHSPTGDLKGVATRYADPMNLQQTWLLPGSGGGRGGGPPRPAPPVTAVVTLASGEMIQGTLDRIDDFVVSLTLEDGSHRTFRTAGTTTKVELRDPLQGHKALLPAYADSDIHNLTAFLVTLK